LVNLFFSAEFMDCDQNCAHLGFKSGLLFLRAKLKVGITYGVLPAKYGSYYVLISSLAHVP
jgi:hypothetical protein